MARALPPAIDWQEGTAVADRSFDAVVCQFGSHLADLGQENLSRDRQTRRLSAQQMVEIEKR